MIETKTTFNETTDGFTPSPEGVYPCHVVAVDSREYNGNKVFNFQFKVADEVEKLELPTMVSDGNGWYTIKVPEDAVVELVVSNSFKLPASKPDLVPENASEELVAACQSAYLEAELSQPKNPKRA